MPKSNKYKTQQKSLKVRDNPKILKEYLTLLHSKKTLYKRLLKAIINNIKYGI